jgi:hypothetical protein
MASSLAPTHARNAGRISSCVGARPQKETLFRRRALQAGTGRAMFDPPAEFTLHGHSPRRL